MSKKLKKTVIKKRRNFINFGVTQSDLDKLVSKSETNKKVILFTDELDARYTSKPRKVF